MIILEIMRGPYAKHEAVAYSLNMIKKQKMDSIKFKKAIVYSAKDKSNIKGRLAI